MSRHIRKARYPALFLVVVVIVGLFIRIQFVESRKVGAVPPQLMPASAQLAVVLHRVGLDPEALAAAGVSPAAAAQVVDNTLEHMAAHSDALGGIDAAWADAELQCDQLKRIIQSGRATPEQLEAYPAAREQRDSAAAQRASLLEEFFAAATADLGTSQRNALTTMRSNRRWHVPLEFQVIERDEAEWVHLRNCLANERTAAKLEEEPDPDAQAMLAELRSHPAVAAAKAGLDTNLAVITNAWEQAVEE
ncbi:MAG: hypothetical protein L0Z62_05955 [Gemmataceae bacterium]|nr:hypothetical protein [Gemmataceae bacterium]